MAHFFLLWLTPEYLAKDYSGDDHPGWIPRTGEIALVILVAGLAVLVVLVRVPVPATYNLIPFSPVASEF